MKKLIKIIVLCLIFYVQTTISMQKQLLAHNTDELLAIEEMQKQQQAKKVALISKIEDWLSLLPLHLQNMTSTTTVYENIKNKQPFMHKITFQDLKECMQRQYDLELIKLAMPVRQSDYIKQADGTFKRRSDI